MEPPVQEEIEETALIQDNSGNRYLLRIRELGNLWVLKVFDRGVQIAQANCTVREDALLVGDLNVYANARVAESRFTTWIKSALNVRSRTANYQRRGLGTKLLRIIIQRARSKGFAHVWGNLFPLDLQTNPNLPAWYRAFGFEVEMAENMASGRIVLQLR